MLAVYKGIPIIIPTRFRVFWSCGRKKTDVLDEGDVLELEERATVTSGNAYVRPPKDWTVCLGGGGRFLAKRTMNIKHFG